MTKQNDTSEPPYSPHLPRLIRMNRNLMTFPLAILNSKAVNKIKRLESIWYTNQGKHRFYFQAGLNTPLPLVEHAKNLDAALALFANNINPEGRLRFRYKDIADIMERKNTSGFRRSFAEGIYRYMHCEATWENAYLAYKENTSLPNNSKVATRGTVSCKIVKASSIWGTQTNLDASDIRNNVVEGRRNPRNNPNSETWNFIDFDNDYIIQTLLEEGNRLFLTELLKKNLRPIPYVIYRYFYGFTDKTYVKRTFKELINAFAYTGEVRRFPKWLEKQLAEIDEAGLIDDIKWPEIKSKDMNVLTLEVKCKNQNPKRSVAEDLDTGRIIDLDNLTPMVTLEFLMEYEKRKWIPEERLEKLEAVKSHLGGPSGPMYLNMIVMLLKEFNPKKK